MKKGSYHTIEAKRKMSKAHKGKVSSFKGKRHTKKTKKKISQSSMGKSRAWLTGKHRPVSVRRKISKGMMGEKNPAWKGGVTPLKRKRYRSVEYKLWREAVRKRDNFTCQACGNRSNLEVHHIKPVSLFPDLIYAINNGITLCKKCHQVWHKNLKEGR